MDFFFFYFLFCIGVQLYTNVVIFLVSSKRTQLCIYTYPFFPKPPYHPGCHITLNRLPCAVEQVLVMCAQSLSSVQLFVTPWTAAHQAPLSLRILQARIVEWVTVPSSKGTPNSGTESRSPTLQVDSLPLNHQGSPDPCCLSILNTAVSTCSSQIP